MSASFATSELFPYVCAHYACRCGRTAMRHGLQAGMLPPGWDERSEAGENSHLCPRCREVTGDAAGVAGREPGSRVR